MLVFILIILSGMSIINLDEILSSEEQLILAISFFTLEYYIYERVFDSIKGYIKINEKDKSYSDEYDIVYNKKGDQVGLYKNQTFKKSFNTLDELFIYTKEDFLNKKISISLHRFSDIDNHFYDDFCDIDFD